MLRRFGVVFVPVLSLAVFAAGGAGGSVVPAANTDLAVPVDAGVDRFVLANQSRCVDVPGATEGDVAVVNITTTQAKGTGWGALRAFGETPVYDRPANAQYSSVNFAANTPPNPNLAFTELGAGGRFCYDGALVDHHVVIDLAAVIPAANANAVTPTRLLDTRGGGLVAASSSRCVGVAGASVGDVAVVNITNTQATGSGWGAVRSSDDTAVYSRPTPAQYSSVNFAANTPPNPNLAVTEIGADGEFCYDGAVASHHVLLDLAAVIPAANVNALTPTRLLDTRNAGGLVAASTSRCVEVAGAADGDVAVVNITNTQATGNGWGALRSPSDTPVFSRPTSGQYSSVNFAANTPPNPNLALAVINGGEFCYDGAVASHHVLLDLAAVIPAANVNAITPTRLLDTRDEPPTNPPTTTMPTTTLPAIDHPQSGSGWELLGCSNATGTCAYPQGTAEAQVKIEASLLPPPHCIFYTPTGCGMYAENWAWSWFDQDGAEIPGPSNCSFQYNGMFLSSITCSKPLAGLASGECRFDLCRTEWPSDDCVENIFSAYFELVS